MKGSQMRDKLIELLAAPCSNVKWRWKHLEAAHGPGRVSGSGTYTDQW